jgi:chromosome segregation ATPase
MVLILKLLTMRHALKNVIYHLFTFLIVEHTAGEHEERITDLERQLAESSGSPQKTTTQIKSPANKELENELKHLSDRLNQTHGSLETLVKKRDDVLTTAQSIDTIEGGDDEESRELLENQLHGIVTRLSRVEDNNSKLYI